MKYDSKGFIRNDIKIFDIKICVNEPFRARLREKKELYTCRMYYIDNKLFLITYMYLKRETRFTVSITEVIETALSQGNHQLGLRICLNGPLSLQL